MPLTRTADVIVVTFRLTPSDIGWIKRVVERSEGVLNRLLLLTGPINDPAVLNLALYDPRIVFLPQSDNPDDVEACNRGFAERAGDAALLPKGASVSPGWLAELCAAAASEERTAFSWPLSSEDSDLAQAEADVARSTGMPADLDTARECSRGLPRFTSTSSVQGECVYLRGQNLDAIGLFDGGLSTRRDAIDDWVMRAQALGFFGKRANHAFVQGPPREPADTDAHSRLECDRSALNARHPNLSHQIESFRQSLDGSLARHAFEFQRTGRLKVAYDIRHLPPENVGTRTYAIELALALARLEEVELSFLVNTPVQAEGLDAPVMTNEEWRDEFAIIHKPAQFFKRQELAIPFSSAAHVVITYQDLIAYRVPAVFHADADYEAYRTTSALSLLCASGILAYSQTSRDEIASEFGIDRAEIALTPLAVDSGSFARRDPADHLIRRDLALPDRYFFSLATDYPHKNLAGLLEAYAELRNRWSDATPPALVLAGYALAARTKVQGEFDSDLSQNGVTFLGPVSPDELRVLYQNAEALVYPSLYEGFGLPPLEAMAAGIPVIAMPFSSVPEAAGDAAIYSDGLAPEDLAQVMERVAGSASLRASLRERGLRRVEQVRWEKTARLTFEAYRKAVLSPTERALGKRRMLREAILRWSQPAAQAQETARDEPLPVEQILGVRSAWKALNSAIQRRVGREARRFQLPSARKRA